MSVDPREPLLNRITNASLDEDYEHVAARRALQGLPDAPGGSHRAAAVIVALFGLLIVIAAVQTSREAAATEDGRQVVIRQIGVAREDLAAKQSRVGELQEGNTALSAGLSDLEKRERSVSREVDRLRLIGGYAAARGKGVEVTLDNAADGSDDGVVRDEDLATLVAGLWQAGAEAIVVNGQRLTAVTGIRTANQAIQIKAHPLRPPYLIAAIGDPDTMQSRFAESTAGATFLGLRNAFDFVFEMRNDDSLDLPGRARPQLRFAKQYDPQLELGRIDP
ncbi:DUF881 domain-containing protein [Nocardioides sp. Bht2]|uniref:DUF881 domain-containing protein n=1 Tax=Nocardioides sp. Bht2 TaxID=3392297 RepID=UPI0039B3ABCD